MSSFTIAPNEGDVCNHTRPEKGHQRVSAIVDVPNEVCNVLVTSPLRTRSYYNEALNLRT